MNEQFVKLHKWMGGMGLTPNELMIFAVIHSYTEHGRGYDGGLAGLTEWTGCSLRTVNCAVRKLESEGWIINSKPSKGRVATVYHSNHAKIAPLRDAETARLTMQKLHSNHAETAPDKKDKIDIDNPPTPLGGGRENADAKPERKRRSSGKPNRALRYIHGKSYTEDDLRRMGISFGEEFYTTVSDELRLE